MVRARVRVPARAHRRTNYCSLANNQTISQALRLILTLRLHINSSATQYTVTVIFPPTKQLQHFACASLSILTLLLYSPTKGVKQKYMLCISGLVVYRQYKHNCSSQVDPHLAHGGESSIRSSAPLAWLHPPGWPPLQLSAAAPG